MRRPRSRPALPPIGLLAAALALAGGCAAGRSEGLNNTSGNDPAGGPGAPSPAPGSPGSAGSGGNGGASGPSGGGSAGASGADAGAVPAPMTPPPAAPPVAPPTQTPPPPPRPPDPNVPSICGVEVSALSPLRFNDLPAGEGYRMRLGARARGARVPMNPTWRWAITHESNQPVPHQIVDGDPAVIEFPTEMTGRYNIVVDVLGVGEPCRDQKTAFAVVPNRLIAKFRVRATPPPGRMLALFEADVQVSAGMPVTKTIDLQRGYPIKIDPQDERGVELPAYYVRVSGRSSTVRIDSYVVSSPRSMGFQALLELGQSYDVLLVPDGAGGVPARAPLAFPSLRAEEFGLQSFRVDPGVRVGGRVLGGAGPVSGARVRMRAGALPSTVGQVDAAGAFDLRVRDGRFEIRVVPPESSGLPEALLPESGGLTIAGWARPLETFDFTYAAAESVRLNLTVQGPAGAAGLAGVRVQLESEPGALPAVGTFVFPQYADLSAVAAGSVRRVRTTDASGVATFEALPRARYRATLVPPDDAPGDAAITVAALDMGAVASAVNGRTVTLGRRTRLTGRLAPATVAAGLVVKAIDTAEDGAGRISTATVGADGRYEVPTDPGRVYRLSIEPPADRRVPRVPLEPFRAKTTDVTLDRTLPARLGLSGSALENGNPLGGAVIQVFCLGSAPTCIDPESPDTTNTPPIDETVSTPDGKYQLYVPDPGQ